MTIETPNGAVPVDRGEAAPEGHGFTGVPLTLDPRVLLSRDVREAARSLGTAEVRYLVDLYYQVQDFRKATDNQVRALSAGGEPHLTIQWSADWMDSFESRVRGVLDAYSTHEPTGMGAWGRGHKGIGPVIAAGLLAHLDITRAPTVGHWWRFAGLDPTSRWEKGQKRPWNAQLKVLCWKIGESFVKVSGSPDAFYGRLYHERKAYEQARNERGELAEQAAEKLRLFKIGGDTEARKHYAAGRLPPAHIHARAKRWAVKLFLAHWHDEAYRRHYGTEPPLPYAIAHLGHAHKIEPGRG